VKITTATISNAHISASMYPLPAISHMASGCQATIAMRVAGSDSRASRTSVAPIITASHATSASFMTSTLSPRRVASRKNICATGG